jgi:hypothetical protein
LTFKHRCLLFAALLTLVHLARFDVAQGPIVTDVRYYVYFAARMADGAVPHRDFFDNKTQLATAAGAALYATATALGVDPLRTMRAGSLALTGLAALLLFAIHRELRRELRNLRDGACIAGLLGMLCYLGFSLLGGRAGKLGQLARMRRIRVGILEQAEQELNRAKAALERLYEIRHQKRFAGWRLVL